MQLGSLRALRHREFALIWTGGLVSNAGSWMQTVAVGALVAEATGQAAWAALVAVAAYLPIGVLGPVGGALADRIDRRRFIIASDLFEGALAAVLSVLAAFDLANPGTVTALVLLAGCSSALRMPFQQSVLPDVVPREDLLAAVSLGSAQFNLGRVIGPAMAGVVVALGGFTLAFAVNAVTFLAAVLAFVLIRLPERVVVDDGAIWSRIRAGARVARAEPGCRAAIGLIATVAVLASPFIALMPAVADRLADGARAVTGANGALTTAQGVGAVLGALALVPLADRFGRRRTLVANLFVTPIALCAYGFAPTVPTAAAAVFVVGASYIGLLSGLSTVVQLRAPEEYRARVLSLYFVALGVIYPVGSLLQGAVADRVGLPQTTAAFAVGLVVVVAALALLRPSVLAALDDPEPGAPADAGEIAALDTPEAVVGRP